MLFQESSLFFRSNRPAIFILAEPPISSLHQRVVKSISDQLRDHIKHNCSLVKTTKINQYRQDRFRLGFYLPISQIHHAIYVSH